MCLSLAGRVLRVDGAGHEALVDVDGTERTVLLDVLTLDGRTPSVGDWVLVHTGFAVDLLTEADARDMLSWHREVHRGEGADR